jgi:hypothetical protein
MLLNTEDDDYSIILHRSKRFQINELDPDIEIENFLLRAFYSPKIE